MSHPDVHSRAADFLGSNWKNGVRWVKGIEWITVDPKEKPDILIMKVREVVSTPFCIRVRLS